MFKKLLLVAVIAFGWYYIIGLFWPDLLPILK